ncbi:hypothetical protein MPL3365_230075 [Mesorhizobium plurifarium]|uniref:Uncharacterized protein n=1 Tax=Mesorhizobium plurifarium TaxID=69974 RepID=A0A090GAU4_MESPL|nr:hypothetical protein MPL3365_230075 [Mesorhizobium plurifarium]
MVIGALFNQLFEPWRVPSFNRTARSKFAFGEWVPSLERQRQTEGLHRAPHDLALHVPPSEHEALVELLQILQMPARQSGTIAVHMRAVEPCALHDREISDPQDVMVHDIQPLGKFGQLVFFGYQQFLERGARALVGLCMKAVHKVLDVLSGDKSVHFDHLPFELARP